MSSERQIQDGLCAYLRKNGLAFIRNRMDKKSCIRVGWPDITVVHCGRAWLCETKTATGKLSAKQKEVISELLENGTPVKVARSVEEAIGSLMTWMGIEHAGEATVSVKRPSEKDGGLGNLFLGSIGGKDYVLSGDSAPGGSAALVRQATAVDLINIPRREAEK